MWFFVFFTVLFSGKERNDAAMDNRLETENTYVNSLHDKSENIVIVRQQVDNSIKTKN